MPYTQEANEAGERINSRPWWTDPDGNPANATLGDLADGHTSDADDPVVLTCTRQQAAQVAILLAYAAMQFDLEFVGAESARAIDLTILVGDQLFPETEAEVGQAVEQEREYDDVAAAEGLIGI